MKNRLTLMARSPMLLLVGSSFVFATKIMVAKAALSAGALPFQLAFVGNLGAGLLVFGLILRSGERIPTSRAHILLYLGLGIISFAAPTVLSYAVVDRVGPAYTSTVYALSPILTMSFAAGLGIERMYLRRFLGILIGLTGMLILVQQQFTQIDTDATLWVALGLLIPAFAAIGNVIRSKFWPAGTSALAFAGATLLTSSVLVLCMAPLFEDPRTWEFSLPVLWGWIALMIAVSAISYVLNFQLQKVAGPVVFSQIGYWGTGFGVVLAALLFGDVLTALSLIGLAAIICGGVIARRAAGKGHTAPT
ncbi:DMT family transporter [Pararhizobium sp. IMCC21322]|uniref:DMT family transporter n=1 Tax=Pararhizobium sp. IMCC21322 TaxID=3067903 RepID=UPI002741ED54|nr:DMT family transporter [Pararhizobium sp. IMCC21322]